MKARLKLIVILVVFGMLTLVAGIVSAQPYNVQFDEYGVGTSNGNSLPYGMATDPISGLTTLMYQLPFNVTRGDLIIYDNTANISDVIRFDNDAAGTFGEAFFFSDLLDPLDIGNPLADVGLPPPSALPSVILFETGPEGTNGVTYTPGPPGGATNDPGIAFQGGALQPVTYTIQSDSIPVPEPTTLVLLGMSAIGLIYAWRKRS
jgi:PEP-CTERM motif